MPIRAHHARKSTASEILLHILSPHSPVQSFSGSCARLVPSLLRNTDDLSGQQIMSSFSTYLVGFIILILGLAIAAYLLNVPTIWIGVGVIVLIGIGVLTATSRTKMKDPPTPPGPGPRALAGSTRRRGGDVAQAMSPLTFTPFLPSPSHSDDRSSCPHRAKSSSNVMSNRQPAVITAVSTITNLSVKSFWQTDC